MPFDNSPAHAEISMFCIDFAKRVRLKDFDNEKVLQFPFHNLLEVHFGFLVVGLESYLNEILLQGFKVSLPRGYVFVAATGESFIGLSHVESIRTTVLTKHRGLISRKIQIEEDRKRFLFRKIDFSDVTVGAMIDIIDRFVFQELYLKKETPEELPSVVGK